MLGYLVDFSDADYAVANNLLGNHLVEDAMKIYTGVRQAYGCRIYVTDNETGERYPLPFYPLHGAGFEWGYGGSGPADTAFAILMEHFQEHDLSGDEWRNGDCKARKLHQDFKWAAISPLEELGFTLTSQEIDDWINRYNASQK